MDGHSYTLDLEAGRRYAVGAQWHLTPRVWVVGSRVSVDDFTDAVDARVSLSGADRVLGGLGVLAETVRPWGDGAFSLRGSVDFERMFRGATTTTQVSGEQLSAVATENSLLVGLNGVYRQGRFSIGRKWRPARSWDQPTANTPASSISASPSKRLSCQVQTGRAETGFAWNSAAGCNTPIPAWA